MVAGKRYVTWDNVPLYPSEAEIAVLVLGPSRAREWPAIADVLEKRGLPKVDPLTGGRYLPAVLAFLDRLHDVADVAPTRSAAEKENWGWEAERRASRRRSKP